jgi:hypothetical protein
MLKPVGAAILVVMIAAALACKSKNAAPAAKVDGRLNFGVLRYDSAALEYRLDSIHNRGLVIQFVHPDAADAAGAFMLIAYAYDTLNDHNNSWMPDTLRVIGDSIPRTLSGRITIGNNEVTREQLLNVVRDANGSRFSYDYVLFTPVVEGVFNHVVYLMRAMKNDKPASGGQQQMTSPMPPSRNWVQ